MWAIMLLGLLYERGLPQRAAIKELFETNVFGRETKFFGVHELHRGLLAGGNHSVRIRQIQAQRLLHYDVLARGGRIQGDLAVKVVGRSNHNQIKLGQFKESTIIGERLRDAEFAGELLHVLPRWRGCGDDPGMGAPVQCIRMYSRYEL
jgi:hypothetical protein